MGTHGSPGRFGQGGPLALPSQVPKRGSRTRPQDEGSDVTGPRVQRATEDGDSRGCGGGAQGRSPQLCTPAAQPDAELRRPPVLAPIPSPDPRLRPVRSPRTATHPSCCAAQSEAAPSRAGWGSARRGPDSRAPPLASAAALARLLPHAWLLITLARNTRPLDLGAVRGAVPGLALRGRRSRDRGDGHEVLPQFSNL